MRSNLDRHCQRQRGRVEQVSVLLAVVESELASLEADEGSDDRSSSRTSRESVIGRRTRPTSVQIDRPAQRGISTAPPLDNVETKAKRVEDADDKAELDSRLAASKALTHSRETPGLGS